MEASKVIFVLLVIYAVAKAAPTDDSCVLSNECNEKLDSELFDEWVCASNGHEMRGFSGNCRMYQYNCDNKDSKLFQP